MGSPNKWSDMFHKPMLHACADPCIFNLWRDIPGWPTTDIISVGGPIAASQRANSVTILTFNKQFKEIYLWLIVLLRHLKPLFEPKISSVVVHVALIPVIHFAYLSCSAVTVSDAMCSDLLLLVISSLFVLFFGSFVFNFLKQVLLALQKCSQARVSNCAL